MDYSSKCESFILPLLPYKYSIFSTSINGNRGCLFNTDSVEDFIAYLNKEMVSANKANMDAMEFRLTEDGIDVVAANKRWNVVAHYGTFADAFDDNLWCAPRVWSVYFNKTLLYEV